MEIANTRPDREYLLARLAEVTVALHDEIGDREALLKEKAMLWEQAEQIGMFVSALR